MCIVVEECDETEYWLEIIQNISLSKQKDILEDLKTEASELTKIMTKSKNTVYNTIKKWIQCALPIQAFMHLSIHAFKHLSIKN